MYNSVAYCCVPSAHVPTKQHKPQYCYPDSGIPALVRDVGQDLFPFEPYHRYLCDFLDSGAIGSFDVSRMLCYYLRQFPRNTLILI